MEKWGEVHETKHKETVQTNVTIPMRPVKTNIASQTFFSLAIHHNYISISFAYVLQIHEYFNRTNLLLLN